MRPADEITFEGERKAITEWALDYGVTPGIIIARLERGDSVECAITTPMKVGHPGQQLPVFHGSQRTHTRRKHGARPTSRVIERNAVIEWQGEKRTLAEWSKVRGISYGTLTWRLREGWPLEIALSKSSQTQGKRR